MKYGNFPGKVLLALAIVMVAFAAWIASQSHRVSAEASHDGVLGKGWLLSLNSDKDRWTKAQKQFRGFDVAMMETGYRFKEFHTALSRENLDLAAYQWRKIIWTISNGIERRPKRQKNSEAFILGEVADSIMADIQSGDMARAWSGFERAKSTCLGCHQAENVPHMNNQPMFDLTSP